MRKLMSTLFAIALLFLATLLPDGSKATARQPWGWYIVVNNAKTETNSISFWVGSNKDSNKWTHVWHRGEPTTFWVGPEFVHSGHIYVNAAVGDHGKNGWFCVDFADSTGNRRGIKHWDFDDSEDHDLNTSDRDDECGG